MSEGKIFVPGKLKKGEQNKSTQNIGIFLVTYTQQFQKITRSAYQKIAHQYAAVHLFQEYSPVEFQTCFKDHLLSKRTVILIILKQYSPDLTPEKIASEQYDQWYHYGEFNTNQQNFSNLVICSSEADSERQIYLQATKKLQLQFVWVGVACKLGGSLAQFVETLKMKQNFQTTKTQFMITFFKIFDQMLVNFQVDENNSEQIYNTLDRCKIEAQKSLNQIEQKIQELVCRKFNKRTIVSGVTEHRYMKLLKSRNYFKLIWIQESTMGRFSLFKNVMKDYGLIHVQKWLNLQNFILLDDYWFQNFVQKVAKQADFTVNRNRNESWEVLIEENYENIIRQFRPNFDEYFLEICQILKTRGGCIKEAIGSIIVKNKRIISTGYNGTPIGSVNCYKGGCRICDNSQVMNTIVLSCNCIHAEYSCIIQAGIQLTPGCTLYTTRIPCLWCSKVIIQAMIETVVYMQTQYPHLSYPNEQKVRDIFNQAKIQLRLFKPNQSKFSK